MIELSEIRVFLCTIPTRMNYSFDGLMGLAQQIFEQDPLSGHLFLLVNRNRDRLKILFWDHGCQDGVSAAPLPPRPIPGGIAGPGLITEVVVGKFGDHLPRPTLRVGARAWKTFSHVTASTYRVVLCAIG